MAKSPATRAAKGGGSVKERPGYPGSWRIRYTDHSGRGRETTFRGSKSAAAAELRRLLGQAPTEQETAGRTVGDMLDEWLANGRDPHGKLWSPKTADTNKGMVEHRIRPQLGHIKLADLSVAHLERAYQDWARVPQAGRTLSDASVRRLAAVISSALQLAVRREYIKGNPASAAVAPAAPKSSTKLPTAPEVKKLIEAAEAHGQDMGKAVALAALTAARCGDIAALRWADIDLKRGTVHIGKAAVNVDGETTIKSTKTGEEYTVTLAGKNLKTLKRALGTPGRPTTYVIGGGTSPIDPGIITDRFTAVRGAAHVRGVTMTSLRHYWATAMLQAGVPMHTVAKVGRWSSTRMLEQVYGHSTAAGEDLARAVELV